ncbi:MAG: organic solvent tolerance protein OstA [Bacteroidota bacterium]|nr:organic solvent tolerance protein OstA [Bacteroidota bacterium]
MRVWLMWGACVLLIGDMPDTDPTMGFQIRADTDSASVAIVTGDSLVGMRVGGEAVEDIYGSVRVTQDSTVLTAAQARRRVDRRMIHFTGQVQMADRGDSLSADTLNYDEARKVGQARSSVRLTDGDVIAYAPVAEHFVDEKRSVFEEGVRLVDSTTVLTGQRGLYWSREKRAELADSVYMTSEELRLRADSLTHLRDIGQSTARGRVWVEQAEGADTTLITGQWVFHDQQAKFSEVRGLPILMQLQQDSLSIDTLVVAADHMRLDDADDETRRLHAAGRVQVWNHEFAAVADSMAYRQAGSRQTALLLGEPTLWIDDTQVTGDTLQVLLIDGELDSLFAYGESFMTQLDSATGRLNQMKGRTLTGASQQDSVLNFVLGPNAEVLYHLHSAEKGADGAMEVSGDQVLLRIENGKLRRVKVVTGTEGSRYEEESLPADLSLEGLQWQPEQRPVKDVLLTGFRRIP